MTKWHQVSVLARCFHGALYTAGFPAFVGVRIDVGPMAVHIHMRMIRLSHLFLALLLVMTLLSMVGVGYLHYAGLQHYARERLTRELKDEARMVRLDLEQQFRSMFTELLLLANHQYAVNWKREMVSPEVETWFVRFTRRTRLVSSLYLLTPEGKVLASQGGKVLSLDAYPQLLQGYRHLVGASNDHTGRIQWLMDATLVPGSDPRALVFTIPTQLRGSENEILSGIIMAVVPIANLEAGLNIYRMGYNSQLQFDSGPTTPFADDYSHNAHMVIGGQEFLPAQVLGIHVSRSAQRLNEAVNASIRPYVALQWLVLLGLAIGVAVAAGWMLRPFNGLYDIIRRIKQGMPATAIRTRIWEFAYTAQMLKEMQARIGEQMHHLADTNRQLECLAHEKEGYLQELADLNCSLEDRVEERTRALALSLERIEASQRFYNQLIKLRQLLTPQEPLQAVLDRVVEALEACHLNRPFAVSLWTGRESEPLSYYHPDFPANTMPPAEITGGDYCLDSHGHLFPLPVSPPAGWIRIATSSLQDEALKGLLLLARELGSYMENRELTEKLADRARTDGLTGLGNRMAYEQAMAALETELDCEVGLFLIDVNGLKEINDSQGHEAGDVLLRAVAQCLRQSLLDMEGALFRIGGDEFVILLKGVELMQQERLLQRLRSCQHQPVTIAGREHCLSFSVGFADTRTTLFSRLYNVADKAMYQQKRHYYQHRREASPSGAQKVEENPESV